MRLWIVELLRTASTQKVPTNPEITVKVYRHQDVSMTELFFYSKVNGQTIDTAVKITDDFMETVSVDAILVLVQEAVQQMEDSMDKIKYGYIPPKEFNPSCRRLPKD